MLGVRFIRSSSQRDLKITSARGLNRCHASSTQHRFGNRDELPQREAFGHQNGEIAELRSVRYGASLAN